MCFFASFFRNISNTDEIILLKKKKKKKKILRNCGDLVYKKVKMSEHRKNDNLRDINYNVKMSVSTLPNFV